MRFALPSRGAGRRLSSRRRAALLAASVLLLAGVGAGLLVTRGSAANRYRTVAAAMGTVEQTVELSGNLTPEAETDLDFGASAKVNAVDVTAGQVVTAGQTLATLDTTTLQGQLTQAKAALSAAQARVQLDEAGATPQNLASANGAVASAQVNLQNDQQSAADTASVNQETINAAQQTVASDQTTVGADQTVVSDDQTAVSNDNDRYTTTDQCTSADPPSPSACSADQSRTAADQKQEATDQQTLARDQASLASAQSSLAAATVHAQQSNDGAAALVRSAQVQDSNAVASLDALEQGTSAAQLTIDQSAVTSDGVTVGTIQTEIDGATLTASVAGEVAQVNITVGQAVSGAGTGTTAAASLHAVVLLTPGAFAVTGSISDAQVSQIAIGQRALVTPAGGGSTLNAHVTAVSPVATITAGVATFPVTVTIDRPEKSLLDGMSASVSIIVNEVVQVLTVPTSAVHTDSSGSYVEVLTNGVAQQTTVTVGAADATRTQVLSGLKLGDTVVLATISASAPVTTAGGARGLLGGGGPAGGGRGGRGG